MNRDLRNSLFAALVIETSVAVSIVLDPSLSLVVGIIGLFHIVPLFILGFIELATKGAFSTGGVLFYPLVFVLQVVLLTLAICSGVKGWRRLSRKRSDPQLLRACSCSRLLAVAAVIMRYWFGAVPERLPDS